MSDNQMNVTIVEEYDRFDLEAKLNKCLTNLHKEGKKVLNINLTVTQIKTPNLGFLYTVLIIYE